MHVISSDGEAKFWIEPEVQLAVNKGLSATELNELKQLVEERQNKIRERCASTSAVEVLNISPHGFWLLVRNREYFLTYDNFPWFRNATVSQLFHVELYHQDHLYWPELDDDLDLERMENPENYPLIAKIS